MINFRSIKAIYIFEMSRTFRTLIQSLISPILSTVLYFIVFGRAIGNNINFIDRTHEGRTAFRGAPREFTSFTDMAEENGYSRIPLGVHIEMDCTEGLRLGYEISDAINAYDLTN